MKPKDKPWFNESIKSAINKRDKLYKRFTKTNSIENHNLYKTQVNNVAEKVIVAKDRYKTSLLDSLQTSTSGSSNYWYYIKKLMGSKYSSNIPMLEHNGICAISDIDKSSLLLNKFLTKFRHTHDESTVPNCPLRTRAKLNSIEISLEAVRKVLLKLGAVRNDT